MYSIRFKEILWNVDAKHALHGYFDSLRAELWHRGVGVTLACPGYVRTDFSANAVRGKKAQTVRPSQVKGISARRVAKAVLRGYLKNKREVIVPWIMHPVLKLYQLFPGAVEWGMTKTVRRMD